MIEVLSGVLMFGLVRIIPYNSVFLVAPSFSISRSEQIDRFCSYVVGVPYASDDLTNEEWIRFSYCRENLRLHSK